jgi:anthranilate/para-aminobenzoate synthase component I
MLVDLTRNDLGEYAVLVQSRSANLCRLERFSHVMHLVSEVQGIIQANKAALDVLLLVFRQEQCPGS